MVFKNESDEFQLLMNEYSINFTQRDQHIELQKMDPHILR